MHFSGTLFLAVCQKRPTLAASRFRGSGSEKTASDSETLRHIRRQIRGKPGTNRQKSGKTSGTSGRNQAGKRKTGKPFVRFRGMGYICATKFLRIMTKNNLLSEQLNYNGASRTPTHLHVCSYNATSVERHKTETADGLDLLLKKECINWIQVHGLQNAGTIRQVCERFNVDFLTTQDILNANHLTKIEEHDNYNVIILKLLSRNQDGEYLPQHLGIVQGDNFLITFTEQETDFFNEILSALDKNVLKIRNRQSDYLLSVILNSVMANFMSVLSAMEDELDDLEERFLSSDSYEDPGIDEIQTYRRNYRLIKKCILPLKEQINKLFHTENQLLHKVNRPFFNDVNDHLQFALQTLEGCRDMVGALIDLYISSNDQRMNSIMKQLTVVSTIFIPLTFLAGIWGMNFHFMPELDWKYGYVYAWALMIVLAVGIYYYFKHKKWY